MYKSQCILYTVNTLLLAMGVVILGVGAAAMTHHSDLVNNLNVGGVSGSQVGAKVLNKGASVAVGAGAVITLVGLLGICATKHFDKAWAKFLMCLYSVFSITGFALAVSAAAMCLALSGQLKKYEGSHSASVWKGDADVLNELQKFANQTYAHCCTDGAPDMNAKGCSVLKNNVLAKASSCMDEATFQNEFFTFLGQRLHTIGVVAAVVGTLSMCTLFASCCLLWRTKKQDEEQRKPLAGDAEAGYYNGQQYQPPTAKNQVAYA